MKNLTLMTDFYQLTMMQGYFIANKHKEEAIFDMFYRRNPFDSGYSIFCGLEQLCDYIKNIKFDDESINYLKSLNVFENSFINYLKDFKFTGDIYSMEEGNVIFPNEPLIRVKSNIMEAQFIETTLLNIINHQSLIATKASRVVWAGAGDDIIEFGLRRAQGADAGIYGSRACIIGGCKSTSNVLAGKLFDVPISGTHAHSWIMSFENELIAFKTYAKAFPKNCILLVDTYDTLRSGVPNAIKVFENLKNDGLLGTFGIRLDSGDLAYISEKAREMLDKAGFNDAKIIASSDLDENLISSLKQQDTKINVWGVGTNLITARDCPAFGGVYKLCATIKNDKIIPKIKLSENPDKVTNPAIKKVVRFFDINTNKIKADLICLDDEIVDEKQDITLFHPINTWKKMTLKTGEFYIKELLKPIFLNGECILKSKNVMDIKKTCHENLSTLWNENRRLINPQTVPVDLSLKLYELKKKMIDDIR